MNCNREILRRAAVILETDDAETLRGVVKALYDKVTATGM